MGRWTARTAGAGTGGGASPFEEVTGVIVLARALEGPGRTEGRGGRVVDGVGGAGSRSMGEVLLAG